jgi:hypothetical protein
MLVETKKDNTILTKNKQKTKLQEARKQDKINIVKHTQKKSKKIKKQKIIGTQKLLNPETGEIIETTIVEKNVEQDFNFFKVWLLDLLNIMELVGTKKMKVINYLFKIMNKKDNTISITYKEIQEKVGVSKPVVVETFKILLESNFLVKIRPSFYRINPDLLVQGNTGKRLGLTIIYKEEKEKMNKEK